MSDHLEALCYSSKLAGSGSAEKRGGWAFRGKGLRNESREAGMCRSVPGNKEPAGPEQEGL